MYDTTWKYGMLKISKNLDFWVIYQILSNIFRQQKISNDWDLQFQIISEQEMGVPLGSILSVTLFSIKIKSLSEDLRDGKQGSFYVDDFVIVISLKT